jgi:hypothetical protein
MSKRNKIIYWIATVWLSLGMLSTGIGQLLKMKTGAGGLDSLTHLGFPVYFLTILGTWKILGVIAILIPKFPIIKEWAYAGFFFLITGALYSHIVMSDSAREILPAVLLLVLTFFSWYFRPMDRKAVAAV